MKLAIDTTGRPVSEPDELGHFGPYGGMYVSETLIHAHEELAEAYFRWREDEEFMARFDADLNLVGATALPTPGIVDLGLGAGRPGGEGVAELVEQGERRQPGLATAGPVGDGSRGGLEVFVTHFTSPRIRGRDGGASSAITHAGSRTGRQAASCASVLYRMVARASPAATASPTLA